MNGHVLHLGETPYAEALDLQRELAEAVKEGTRPDTVIFLEHPPVVTLGRRTDDGELHVPAGDDADNCFFPSTRLTVYDGAGVVVGRVSPFSQTVCFDSDTYFLFATLQAADHYGVPRDR